MKSNLILLWSHTGKRRHIQFGLILILMIISSILEVVSIGLVLPLLGILTDPDVIFQHEAAHSIIDFFQFTAPDELILPVTIVFIMSALSTSIVRVTLLYATTKFSYATGADIAVEVYRRTLYQDYAVHIAQHSSEIINSVTTKTNAVITGALNPALIFLSSLLLIIFTTSALLFISPIVALASFTGFGFIYWLIILYTHKQLKENSECIAKESTQIIKSIQEGLGGIRDVIIDSNQEFYIKTYKQSDRPFRQALGNNQFINGSPRFIMESIGMIMIASMAYFMSLQEGGVSSVVPVLGALALGAQRILPALQQLYSAYISINGSHASVNDALILLEQPLPNNIDLLGNQSIEFNKCIYLKDVGFKYPGNERRVIKNIDLKIKKGSIVGFMGPTGSGKSTLLDILMGLLNPTSGGIYIDNVKVDKNNQYLWQKNIAHVPQNIFLSDGSIEENIALGVPIGEIDTIRVKDAARQAQLDKVIENLPCGYQTIIGEDGNFLSGGQKQRIGIARAIYKRAQVLIFDEATSALDTKTEAEVMKSIYSLGENLTILIIAHRVSTLKGCDWLVKITNGKSEIVKSDQEVFK